MAGLLFVIAQPGAAAFFAPLWQRWSQAPEGRDWRIMLRPSARAGAGDEIQPTAWLDWPEDGEIAIGSMLGGWRPDLVVTSTTYHAAERAAMDYAAEQGCASAQLVDSHYNTPGSVFLDRPP